MSLDDFLPLLSVVEMFSKCFSRVSVFVFALAAKYSHVLYAVVWLGVGKRTSSFSGCWTLIRERYGQSSRSVMLHFKALARRSTISDCALLMSLLFRS